MLNKQEAEPKNYAQLESKEYRALPTAKDMLRQATLQLGGTSGQEIKVEDIRHYLDARLLCHLELGDTTSKAYQLLEQARDLSSSTGVHAAIEVFKTQFESLEEEMNNTPKGKGNRNLHREGFALGLSITKLEKETLPKAQKGTDSGKLPSIEEEKVGKEEIDIFDFMFVLGQPVSHKVTSGDVQFLLDNSSVVLTYVNFWEFEAYLNLKKEAMDFRKSEIGRKAAVKIIKMQEKRIIRAFEKEKVITDLMGVVKTDRFKLNMRNFVNGVEELMRELEKGSERS